MESLVMPFGKYKNQKIKDIPFDYLRWWINNIDDEDPRNLWREIREYLSRNGELNE